MNSENQKLNLKLEDFNNLKDENIALNESIENLKSLKEENLELKIKLQTIENLNENKDSTEEKDKLISQLQEEYINLSKKYDDIQEELYSTRYDKISNEYTIKRLKNFILNQN